MKRGSKWFAQKSGRRDGNHAAIRDGLRKLGHYVVDTAGVGGGVFDLCVYARLKYLLNARPVWLEVKTDDESLTPLERDFGAELTARGIPWAVVRSFEEAVVALR